MILADTAVGSAELAPLIRAQGVRCDTQPLSFGDFCFEGYGPEGRTGIGIERKRLHDMLDCIDDARYTGHQRIGMRHMYQFSILTIEGLWRPHDESGELMEGFYRDGKLSWAPCRYRNGRVLYSKLRRYLFSVSLAGVVVTYTRDPQHTAADTVEWFHYFQKPWKDHTALLAMQKFSLPQLPTLNEKPSLCRRWAADLEDIGLVKSEAAERLFKRPIVLATAEVEDWAELAGVGIPTARKIVRQIHGQ